MIQKLQKEREGGGNWLDRLSSLCACRYALGHIWACPPSEGDDYIFHCHPAAQKIPKPKRLQDWYKAMLDSAQAEGAVSEYKVSTARGFVDLEIDRVSFLFLLVV